jgi:hypothetical protein
LIKIEKLVKKLKNVVISVLIAIFVTLFLYGLFYTFPKETVFYSAEIAVELDDDLNHELQHEIYIMLMTQEGLISKAIDAFGYNDRPRTIRGRISVSRNGNDLRASVYTDKLMKSKHYITYLALAAEKKYYNYFGLDYSINVSKAVPGDNIVEKEVYVPFINLLLFNILIFPLSYIMYEEVINDYRVKSDTNTFKNKSKKSFHFLKYLLKEVFYD